MKIFVVDDQSVNCKLLAANLRRWGFEAEVYTDSQAAYLRILEANEPVVAFLDWMMPEMSGIEIVKGVRREKPESPIYMILVTAKAEKDDLIEGLEAGADDYVIKPFNSDELRSRMYAGIRILELQEKISRRAQIKLTSKVKEQEDLIGAIRSGLLAIDHEDRIIFCNATSQALFKGIADLTIGTNFFECGLNWNWGEISTAIAACRAKQDRIYLNELSYTNERGDRPCLAVSINPFRRREAESGALLVIEDISERRDMEASLQRSARLESIGRLASGVANEINMPMQAITENLRFLRDCFQDLEPIVRESIKLVENSDGACKECDLNTNGSLCALTRRTETVDIGYLGAEVPAAFKQSLEGLERISALARAMQVFSQTSQERALVDVNELLRSVITIARGHWQNCADVTLQLWKQELPVLCFPGDLNQAFLNLIINAAQAVTERKATETSRRGRIRVATREQEGAVVVEIEDNGVGIHPDVRPRIYEPFFTTREMGDGSGQGLTISRQAIVEKHGGRIDFESRVGVGTVFTVRLPLEIAAAA